MLRMDGSFDDARPISSDETAIVVAHDIALELLALPPEARVKVLAAVRALVLPPDPQAPGGVLGVLRGSLP